jgi:hypothetical protein
MLDYAGVFIAVCFTVCCAVMCSAMRFAVRFASVLRCLSAVVFCVLLRMMAFAVLRCCPMPVVIRDVLWWHCVLWLRMRRTGLTCAVLCGYSLLTSLSSLTGFSSVSYH